MMDEDKLTPTLNNMGWMVNQNLDPYTESFINYAVKIATKPVLEVGAAYGVAAPRILAQGGKVVVNDLDGRHLDVLLEQTPEHIRSQLVLMPGSFVDEIEITPNSLSAILCGRVFHFFDVKTIAICLARFANWLEPKGKLYITADSIYHGMNESIFDGFLKRKAEGCENPGRVELINNPRVAEQANREEILASMPPHFNFMDIETLTKLFNEAGFLVQQASYFPAKYYYDISLWDGREGIGLIGEKHQSLT